MNETPKYRYRWGRILIPLNLADAEDNVVSGATASESEEPSFYEFQLAIAQCRSPNGMHLSGE